MTVSFMHRKVVRMAVIQMASKTLDKKRNISRTIELLEQAVREKAELIVLPELCTSGYNFKSLKEATSVSETIPNGLTTRKWVEFAEENNVYLVGGVCESAGNSLYNSAVIVGPEGYVGTYRKVHLWHKEKIWFKAGSRFKVFDTPLGKIGAMICYDSFFPETTRILTRMGADVVCQPTATQQEDVFDFLINQVRSAENAIFIGTANLVGKERDIHFAGQSQITNPQGKILVKELEEQESVLTADINISEATKAKQINELNNIISDRRTDLYLDLFGYAQNQE
jgi:N-carbamoylputrescine amidase